MDDAAAVVVVFMEMLVTYMIIGALYVLTCILYSSIIFIIVYVSKKESMRIESPNVSTVSLS
jgi:hypothetical protein